MILAHDYRAGRFVAGVLFTLTGVAFLLEGVGAWRVDLVLVWPLCLIGFGTAVLLGRARRIKVEEERSAELAVAEERVRIARELHDIVAHSVTLMTVQVAAARRVARSKPDAADHALATAEETGRQSLAELRSLLQVLRYADASIGAASPREGAAAAGVNGRGVGNEPLPGLADLDTLVAGFRAAGLEVAFETTGDRPDVSGSVGLAVYRVVQEALTNVVRHSRSPDAKVTVLYGPEAISVWVEDSGQAGITTPKAADGHGLLGMRERVVAAGGVLEVGPRPSGRGWQVHAWIPVARVDVTT